MRTLSFDLARDHHSGGVGSGLARDPSRASPLPTLWPHFALVRHVQDRNRPFPAPFAVR